MALNRNIVSFCLYGSRYCYWEGAVSNIYLCKIYYPTFICVFYIDRFSDPHLIKLIEDEQKINSDVVEIRFFDRQQDSDGMFYRFLPATEINTNIFLSRDTDCRINERECIAVNEWLASDKDFHIIRDHKILKKPVYGGMWGCRNKLLNNIGLEDQIKNFVPKIYGADEDLLCNWLYPKIQNSAFEHSSFGVKFNNDIHNIKADISKGHFIGKKICKR